MAEEISTKKYSEVRSKKIDWLWYPYIAYGKVTLLVGDPGDGKSTFALQVAAILTAGRKFPTGNRVRKPINVIYQCNEDDPADTIKPRLVRAKADCNRVLFFNDADNLTLDDKRLEKAIETSNAKLVIFDPIQSFLSADADMVSAVRMRAVLKRISEIAKRQQCAILLIGHLNKSVGGKDLYRALGSIDISAVARSVLMISRDEEAPETRYMTQIKNNIGYEGPVVSFKLTKEGFEWGEVISKTSQNDEKESNAPIDVARAAITALIQDGEVSSNDLFLHLDSLGLSRSTTRRAIKDLGLESKKHGKVWYWQTATNSESGSNSKKGD